MKTKRNNGTDIASTLHHTLYMYVYRETLAIIGYLIRKCVDVTVQVSIRRELRNMFNQIPHNFIMTLEQREQRERERENRERERERERGRDKERVMPNYYYSIGNTCTTLQCESTVKESVIVVTFLNAAIRQDTFLLS